MKKQTVLISVYRDECHKLLDRVALAVAAKEAVVHEAKKWAHRAKSLKGTNQQLKREIAKQKESPNDQPT